MRGRVFLVKALQAQACGIEPHSDMNPVLLKPTSDCNAQVVIQGKALTDLDARGFHDYNVAGNSIPNNATLTNNTSPAGDVLISTKGFVAGDNYTIILEVR